MNAVIVIPVYNEKNNLRLLMEEIFKVTPNIGILIVDDNSPDGTGILADELSKKYRQVKVLHREKREGLGRAYIAGFKEALKMGPDYLLQMDADLSHHPKYLPLFLKEIASCDIVLGSRFLNTGRAAPNISLLSICANRYAKWVLGLRITDPLGGFRCFRREVIEKVGLDGFISKGFIFQAEFICRASRLNLSIHELPIDFFPRNSGSTKKSIGVILEAILKLNLLTKQFSQAVNP